METHTRSEQSKSLPQGGEIQNGDTGNHQDFPPTRGVGDLNRLQGRLLSYPHTGTIQEISEISCRASDVPVQSSALWSVHSTYGVHCGSKGGETDGPHKGIRIDQYLDESHQTCLQHTQALVTMCRDLGWLVNVEKSELEPKKVFDYQFVYATSSSRLPVRPQVRSGPTNTGPVAEPSRKNTITALTTSLSGPAVHVPDRFANSYRETSSSRPTTYETHTVASQKPLESTRVTRIGHSFTQVPAPTFTMVAGEELQRAPRSTITPNKTCSASLYRRIKRRVGAHLNERTARGSWSLPESKLHINYLELKAVFLALKEFKDLCSNQIVLVATDNTTVVSYINKEGGMKSGPLCALLWRILTWCTSNQVTLKARHIPGRLNVVADKLSRLVQTIQTEWSLLPEVFQAICSR